MIRIYLGELIFYRRYWLYTQNNTIKYYGLHDRLTVSLQDSYLCCHVRNGILIHLFTRSITDSTKWIRNVKELLKKDKFLCYGLGLIGLVTAILLSRYRKRLQRKACYEIFFNYSWVLLFTITKYCSSGYSVGKQKKAIFGSVSVRIWNRKLSIKTLI